MYGKIKNCKARKLNLKMTDKRNMALVSNKRVRHRKKTSNKTNNSCDNGNNCVIVRILRTKFIDNILNKFNPIPDTDQVEIQNNNFVQKHSIGACSDMSHEEDLLDYEPDDNTMPVSPRTENILLNGNGLIDSNDDDDDSSENSTTNQTFLISKSGSYDYISEIDDESSNHSGEYVINSDAELDYRNGQVNGFRKGIFDLPPPVPIILPTDNPFSDDDEDDEHGSVNSDQSCSSSSSIYSSSSSTRTSYISSYMASSSEKEEEQQHQPFKWRKVNGLEVTIKNDQPSQIQNCESSANGNATRDFSECFQSKQTEPVVQPVFKRVFRLHKKSRKKWLRPHKLDDVLRICSRDNIFDGFQLAPEDNLNLNLTSVPLVLQNKSPLGFSENCFKFPLKRPPTRQKSVTQLVPVKKEHQPPPPVVAKDLDEDDSISLYAESIVGESVVDVPISKPPVIDQPPAIQPYIVQPPPVIQSYSFPPPVIQPYSVPPPVIQPYSVPPPVIQPYVDQPPCIVQPTVIEPAVVTEEVPNYSPPTRRTSSESTAISAWVESSSSSNQRALDFETIPRVYNNICYYYCFLDNCKRKTCSRLHRLPNNFTKLLNNLSVEDLRLTYNWGKEYHRCFLMSTYYFINAFAQKDLKQDLCTIVSDSFKMKNADPKEYIDQVIIAFGKYCGMKLPDCLEYILIQLGISSYPKLSDMLLESISEQCDFEGNWDVIKKLAIGRTSQFDAKTVMHLINKCTSSYPVHANICSNILYLMQEGLVDTAQLPQTAITAMKMAGNSRNKQRSAVQESSPNSHTPLVQIQREINTNGDLNNNGREQRTEFQYQCDSRSPSNSTTLDENEAIEEVNRLRLNSSTINYDNLLNQQITDSEQTCSSRSSLQSTSLKRSSDEYFQEPKRRLSSTRTDSDDNCKNVQPIYKVQNQTPIFGKPKYDPDFRPNISLHNLYPITDTIDINDDDIMVLNEVVRDGDGKGFLDLMEKYKSTLTVKNLICMTIAELKSYKHLCYNMYMALLSSIEHACPTYMNMKNVKAILEVITYNIIFELERYFQFKPCVQLLQKFHDWDSMLTSQIISNNRVSMMGRYLHLCKVFARANDYALCFELLQNQYLNMLKSVEKWPLSRNNFDPATRDRLLKLFFEEGYCQNMFVVNELFKKALKKTESINFDVIPYINPMFENLIDKKQITTLKFLFKDINYYIDFFQPNVLRGLLLTLSSCVVSEYDLEMLYEKCVKRGIYKSYNGSENQVNVYVDMLDLEIELTLKYFLKRLNLQPQITRNVIVDIGLPDRHYSTPKILENCVRSLYLVNKSILNILVTKFDMTGIETGQISKIILNQLEVRRYCKSHVWHY